MLKNQARDYLDDKEAPKDLVPPCDNIEKAREIFGHQVLKYTKQLNNRPRYIR